MIQIIPAIDIINGQCVRLTQGDYERQTTYPNSPVETARQFADAGITRIHLVDLEGAKAGEPRNLETLKAIADSTDLTIEWGGGIKTTDHLYRVFCAGADAAIIGSVAVSNPALMTAWLETFGGEKIVLGADVRGDKIAVGGWMEDTDLTLDDIIKNYTPHGLREVICTDISRDGMLLGPSFDLYSRLIADYPGLTITASGGIGAREHITELERRGVPRVIVGKALYEGKITL